jgi:ABC-type polysaccharide/polyol phosphate export permease
MISSTPRIVEKVKSIMGLSLSLATANFKLRNEGSYLGVIWYLIYPLALFMILLHLAGWMTPNQPPSYPLYLLLGILMYNFFIATTQSSTGVINSYAGFIKSMKINSESFVVANILQFIFSHIFEIAIFWLFMVYYGSDMIYLAYYLLYFVLFSIFVLGLSFTLATIGVFVTDLGNVWAIVGRLLFFITPIFFKPPQGDGIYELNPLYLYISMARDTVIYDKIPTIQSILPLAAISTVSLLIGLALFEKYKHKFAEKL